MAKKLATVFGIVFILMGIVGILPNMVIGDGAYFQANNMMSALSVFAGLVLLLVMAKSNSTALVTVETVGIIYIILGVMGMVMSGPILMVFVSNMANNWLNLIIGVLMVVSGFSGGKKMMSM